ncbi:Hypothetical protein R9X50_00686600 [Acrodontium crateriforme]|uniref:Small secreted protein n=1 Tax=Acrodontium crateriforme TaxID=150365 RepID=A0AAQ3MBM6_9PEZI|nr:Hypothetical protein R9X50_00686600 [Acrodontium crateriforme]
MQFTNAVLALSALAGSALAAPTLGSKNMMATNQQWTIQDFHRGCGPAGKACSYHFAINTNDGSQPTQCNYQITATPPAARASYSGIQCGDFTISSSWSGQFGEGKGFQVLAVVSKDRQIIYPSYTDAQIGTDSAVVKPDQSYTPQNLPQ